jgi:cytidine deaminase
MDTPHDPKRNTIVSVPWSDMSALAWKCRVNAHLYGPTAVGAVALASTGRMYAACNVEHRFRCHDIHAEVNAIGQMVAHGDKELVAIVIVAERKSFTPCGGCLDWIAQFGGAHCLVAHQASPEAPVLARSVRELIPFYPE